VARTRRSGHELGELADERDARQEVLHVVDHQEEPLGREDASEGPLRTFAGCRSDVKRLGDGCRGVFCPSDAAELNPVHALAEPRAELVSHGKREPRLPDAAGTRERDDADI
jgi:hypothetical protein